MEEMVEAGELPACGARPCVIIIWCYMPAVIANLLLNPCRTLSYLPGKLKPKVSREIDLQEEEVREAFRRLHERRLVGKQVLRIDPDLP